MFSNEEGGRAHVAIAMKEVETMNSNEEGGRDHV